MESVHEKSCVGKPRARALRVRRGPRTAAHIIPGDSCLVCSITNADQLFLITPLRIDLSQITNAQSTTCNILTYCKISISTNRFLRH